MSEFTFTNLETPASSEYQIKNHIYDVIIVGAGPIGLATALGLYQRGLDNILVIDQAHSFRQVGQVIDILPNGLKCLKMLDENAYTTIKQVSSTFANLSSSKNQKSPEENQQATTPPSQKWVIKNIQGQQIRSMSLNYEDWRKDYDEGRVSISWYNLQTNLRNLLPESCVKANHRCVDIIHLPELNCVQIDCISDTTIEANPYGHWEKWDSQKQAPENSEINNQTSAKKTLWAKLVVGADGIKSTVRHTIYKDTSYQALSRPEYSGYSSIFCFNISDIPTHIFREIEDKFLAGFRLVTIVNNQINSDSDCMETPSIIIAGTDGNLGYMLNLAVSLQKITEKSGADLIDFVVQELKKADFPECIQELVSFSSPENINKRPYYLHRAAISPAIKLPRTAEVNIESNVAEIQPPWSAGSVVLVGDAAHGMPPFMAQGFNQGLEDALTIVTLITNLAKQSNWDNTTAIFEACQKYEKLRRPLMIDIQNGTLSRVNYGSEAAWKKYNQLLYQRNFEEIMQGL